MMNPIELLTSKINEANLWKKEITLKRNEYLKVEGSTDTNLYYVDEGSLRIFVVDEVEEHTIRFGYQGNFIAALDSFISENPSPFYIQALKKTVVKVVSKSDFISFLKSDIENLELWDTLLQGLIIQQLEREIDILTSSPVERYKRVLKRSPQLFQEIPHKHIASYLRMTPETLSRIKKS